MKCRFFLIFSVLWAWGTVSGQHYSAIHGGSNYFGSLSVYNNPSSIVNTPYKWDLTLIGLQYTGITNALRGRNFPFYFMPNTTFTVANGNYSRRADMNYNIRLLNARYSINKAQAVAFGINFKGYAQAVSGTINYSEQVKGALSFLSLNEQNRVLQVHLAGSAWMEAYGTYGFTLWNKETSRLTGGLTLRLSRGMAGVYADADDVLVQKSTQNDLEVSRVSNGHARYGYSANLKDGSSFSAGDLFSGSRTSLGADLGVEYLVKTQAVTSVYDEGDEQNDYEWKLGFALLDIGANHFKYSPQSRSVSSLKSDVTGNVLQDKFFSVKDVSDFNDSLETIVNDAARLNGNFAVSDPFRAVFNVDRYVSGNFYVNGELSVNLASGGQNRAVVKESNLVTITPRWESRKLGLFVPVQYTRHGNFWIGGALKAGPLLLGTHNLLNIFSSNQYVSGGAYLALILRPSGFIKDPRNRQYDCPSY